MLLLLLLLVSSLCFINYFLIINKKEKKKMPLMSISEINLSHDSYVLPNNRDGPLFFNS